MYPFQSQDLVHGMHPTATTLSFMDNRERFLGEDVQESEIELFRRNERTGRVLGTDSFIEKMELFLDRKLKPQKPGPKKKDK